MDRVVVPLATHLLTPLGVGTEENFRAAAAGRSALRRYEGILPEAFVASILGETALDAQCEALGLPVQEYTYFEKMLLAAAVPAVAKAGIDASSDRVLFVVSTTKGNVSLLGNPEGFAPERVLLGQAARRLTAHFGNPNEPLVVCNACISGVCAQIAAMRNLRSGAYDYVVTVGADQQSPFIIAGFQCLKALSDDFCRPFDAARRGLNLGECAAAMVFGQKDRSVLQPGDWMLCRGAVRSDANHISGPSRTGEGSYEALRAVLKEANPDRLAFVSVHGTATNYNDEMESIALERAGLSEVPVCGLKGIYGHTMGAAGLLECILSMASVEHGKILPTKGFETLGVSRPVRVSAALRDTSRQAFVKLISGFGGCNAAVLYQRYGYEEA